MVIVVVDLVASLVIRGPSPAMALSLIVLVVMDVVARLARRGRVDSAAAVMAVALLASPVGIAAASGSVDTWPITLPLIGLLLAFVVPIRAVPLVVVACAAELAAMAWLAASRQETAVPMAGLIADTGVIIVATIGLGLFGAIGLARSERAGLAALALAEHTALLAGRDPLTGVFNRRIEDAELAPAVDRAAASGQQLAVAMIDVDGFKAVNDLAGHQAGDEVLVDVSRLIAATCRRSDILVRHGGDEFVLAMPQTSAAVAADVCERLRRQVADNDWSRLPAGVPAITVSVGIADTRDGACWPDLVAIADGRLLAAKGRGRNRVVAHDA